MSAVRPVAWFRHLRLPFNLLLSPIYLYGAAAGAVHAGVARPLADPAFWLAFASLHLFLYGGTTAFNSYYDRDEGPVGGMLSPPPVDRGLLPFSLVVQAIGLALAVPVDGAFLGLWLALFALFTAYSHPSVRLKARPGVAMATIAIGQGGLAFALGWTVFAPAAALAGAAPLVRMALTAMIVTGLYVVTQSYQVEEDRARGDRTLPVVLGPARALRWAAVVLAAGGAMLAVDLARWAGASVAVLAAVATVALAGALVGWSRRVEALDTRSNFRIAMSVSTVTGVATGLLLLALLAGAIGG
jgi:1,4-dihydroxy-2-naphthoate octaprenyltransferase